MIDMRRLRLLREVAITGSVTAAARRLSFTPSAVSQQISLLERETGVTLLERVGRGVLLTDAAMALVERAEVILAELARAESDIEAIGSSAAGSLAVGAFPTSGTQLVPTALQSFSDGHPAVDVRLVELEPEHSLPMLRRGELDLALAYECDLVPLSAGVFEQTTLFREPMLVVLSEALAGSRQRLELRRLEGQSWIVPPPGNTIHEFTLRVCQAAGFQPRIGSVWSDFQVVQSLAAAGLGVAFAPELALDLPRPGVAIRRTTTPLTRRVFAAWRAGNSRAPLILAMIDAFQEARGTAHNHA